MPSIGEVSATLSADADQLTSGVDEAVGSLRSLQSALGFSSAAMAGLAAAGAAAAAGGIAASVQQAMKLERTLRGAAARAGATQDALAAFGRSAKQASLDSAFGANQAGKALRFMAKSGLEVEQATKALPSILQGATAAGMGAADMGRIATNAMRAFGKSAGEVGNVMDVLVKASINANTSVQELGQGIATAGGIASATGQSLEETVAIISSMQNAGISASKAATAVRSGLARMASPTAKAKTTMRELGVSVRNSSGELKSMVTVLGELQQAGASAGDMAKIFGKRMGPTLTTALQQSDGALQEMVSGLNNAEGTAKRVASFIRDSFSEQVKVLAGQFATLGAQIGELFLPVLQGMAAAMKKVVSFTSTMVGVVKDVGAAFSGWTIETKKAKSATDKMGSAQSAAAAKIDKVKTASELATDAIKSQKSAQRGLNKSVEQFIGLSDRLQREAFQNLASRSRKIQSSIGQTRRRLQEARREMEKMSTSAQGASGAIGSELAMTKEERAQREKIVQLEKTLKGLRQAQASVERKLTKAAEAKLKKQKLNTKFSQKSADAAARETRELKKQNAALKKAQSLVGGAAGAAKKRARGQGFRGGFDPQRGRKLRAKALIRKRRRVRKAKRKRNFARDKRVMRKHSAAAKKSNNETQKAAQASNQAAQAAQKVASSVSQLSGTLLQAAGASKQAQSAISGVVGAIKSVIGGIGGGPVGIVTGVIGGITSLVQGFSKAGRTGGGATQAAASPNRNPRRFADILAKRIGEEVEDAQKRKVVTNIDARGALVGSEREVSRKIGDLVEEEARLREGGLL